MANQEHVALLKQGVDVWNQWRQEHLDIHIDLNDANLSDAHLNVADLVGADLSSIDLSSTDLKGSNLSRAYLYKANLSGAYLYKADLSDAYLNSANLSGTYLSGAYLTGSNLSGAYLYKTNLSDAYLNSANLSSTHLNVVNLSSAHLDGADLTQATVGWTSFADVDLGGVKGLDTVMHEGPSSIGIDTIYRSHGQIPESFLRGAGVPEPFITNMRALVESMSPIDFYSCFISYSSKDQDFADRLHADLQSKGVRCWYAPESLKIGDKFWHRIDESIKLYDKLLVVLSEHSINSAWVENEVMTALEKEHQQHNKLVLFPIKLDETVMQTSLPWAASLRRARHIGDFCAWKQHESYQKALSRLLRDLKQS